MLNLPEDEAAERCLTRQLTIFKLKIKSTDDMYHGTKGMAYVGLQRSDKLSNGQMSLLRIEKVPLLM